MTAGIVNGVVGAGIFSLPQAMAGTAGAYAPWAYLACALAMGAIVACFAEASSRVPTSGGSSAYVEAALGPLAGFVAGVLLWLSSVLACGGIAAAFADGLGAALPLLAPAPARVLLILAVAGGIAAINIAGVAPAARFIGIATIVKLLPLGLFVVVGAVALGALPAPGGSAPPAHDFGRAVILALFAFCGMETPLAASGEVRDPARAIPRALFLSMGFVVLLYVAIQIVAQGLLGPALAGAATPLADGMARVSPRLGLVLIAGATFSRLVWIASDFLGAPRVLFVFARERLLPAALGRVHPRTRTPHVAIATHAALVAMLAISGTFEKLAILSTLATAGLYFLACGAAWLLARRGVALFGTPLGLRALPLAAMTGMASMVALVLFAQWAEIAGLIAVIAASAALYGARRMTPERGWGGV